MSYKMPKITNKRKLCPRCGSPLMDMIKYLKCPLCGYSTIKGESKARVTIKYSKSEELEKMKPEIKVFQVLPSGIAPANSLKSNNVYLISDPVQHTIWLWKGNESRPGAVYNAGSAATKLKASEKLYGSKLVHVEEGEEPPEFPDITQKAVITKEMVTEAQESVLIETPPDGQHNIYLINKGELEKIEKPVFTTGDSYLIDTADNIWIWVGKNATVDEKFSAAHLSTVIDVSRQGKAKIISVDQGNEPNDLRVILSGLKIVDKNIAESLLKHVEKDVWEPVLYRISSEEVETINDIIYIQVPLTKDSLDSEDVFLLDDRTNNKTYIWIGSKASVKEKVVGGQIARKFELERAGVQEEIFIYEGEEPEAFRQLLGMQIESTQSESLI